MSTPTEQQQVRRALAEAAAVEIVLGIDNANARLAELGAYVAYPPYITVTMPDGSREEFFVANLICLNQSPLRAAASVPDS